MEGQGSTFYLLVAAAKSPGPDAELPMAYPRGPSRQAVLYAPACLASSVLQANLQEFGINATLASIEESNLRAAPDFVFVDADEPTINSEVLQTLRGRHEGSKVCCGARLEVRPLKRMGFPIVRLPRHFDRCVQIGQQFGTQPRSHSHKAIEGPVSL